MSIGRANDADLGANPAIVDQALRCKAIDLRLCVRYTTKTRGKPAPAFRVWLEKAKSERIAVRNSPFYSTEEPPFIKRTDH